MKIIHTPDYAEMSRRGADLLAAQVLLAPRCVLGLATGSTPVGMYDELSARCAAGRLSFAEVTSVNLEEYVGVTPDHPQSYRTCSPAWISAARLPTSRTVWRPIRSRPARRMTR